MMDDGATVTLVDQAIADKVGLHGDQTTLYLRAIKGVEMQESSSQKIDIKISKTSGSERLQMQGARTVNNLLLPSQSLIKEEVEKYQHLSGLEIIFYKNASPRLLIGQDHSHLITPCEIRASTIREPVASLTPLGWIVHGNILTSSRNRINCATTTIKTKISYAHNKEGRDRELNLLVKQNFDIEALGISTTDKRSSQDERVNHLLAQNTRRIGLKWETGLLWRDSDVKMPCNKNYAYQRLRSIEKKMDKDPQYGIKYIQEIEKLLKAGYARRVTHLEENIRRWYLPHLGVINPNKPEKMRIVFDAAARTSGVSLNDQILSGSDLVKPLLGVLMRFRIGKIAFIGDIKEMFLQVKINERDQDSQLFLWRGWSRNTEPRIYAMTSMIFGASSSPHVAQYIKNRNAQEFMDQHPDAVKAILHNHYVDDYLDSVKDEEEAWRRISEVTIIHSQGGFGIRGWVSNSESLTKKLSNAKQTTEKLNLNMNQSHMERTLGLMWDPKQDTFQFDLSMKKIPGDIINGIIKPTKRQMLRVIMSVYDPLGILSPFTIKGKILLQEVWRTNIGWDDQLEDKENSKWLLFLRGFSDAEKCQIPRWYQSRNETPVQIELHIFCDAGERAYSAVAYWRMVYNDNCFEVSFIVGKSRVAPLKPTSIPRMELQGALVACRLAQTIADEHDVQIDKRVFWTDSTNVLGWIKTDPRKYQSFVAHRLGEIDELTNVDEWRWIPSKLNPADNATRDHGSLKDQLDGWTLGPVFLSTESSNWPIQSSTSTLPEPDEEKKKEFVTVTIEKVITPLPNIERFSKWLRLIRSTAMVFLVPKKWIHKQQVEITFEIMELAEQLWIKRMQENVFASEIAALKNREKLPKNSRISNLAVILGADGVLRINGRISQAREVPQDIKTPIILDGNHRYAKLLIQDYHERLAHGSSEAVVNELRQKYWIVKIRPNVKFVISRCQNCRVRKAIPEVPTMGNLPHARVAHHQRPFSFSGIDYFGPMNITVGRRHEKRWGVLITCLTTRAVHLELAATLSTDSAIMAIRRMIARRGSPIEIHSDNGTNLVGTNNELKRALKEVDFDAVNSDMMNRGIKWKFIPPNTPHMGGSWERLVRSVKVALKVVLNERFPKEETLLTLLTEVEHIVNSRPLTHVTVNHVDEESLTPNHFLIGTSSASPNPGLFTNNDLHLKKQWRIAQRLTDMFWTRWVKEYLPNLNCRKKWNQDVRALQVGDVVLIVDPLAPRNNWQKGIIVETIPGNDGRIRVVKVRTKGGNILTRGAAKIIVLAAKEES